MARYGHELTDAGAETRAEVKNLQLEFTKYMAQLKAAVGRNELSPESLLDVAWIMQEIARFSESMDKEASKMEELLEKVCCMVWVSTHAGDPGAAGHIEGFIARGTPKTTLGSNLPARGTDGYKRFMRWLGHTDEQIANDLVRPHWPHVQDMLTARAEQGLPTPPGVPEDTTYNRYKLVSLQQKKGVNIDG